MESLERLRSRARGHYSVVDLKLLEIAGDIEREHRDECNRAYSNGYDEGFASTDDWLADYEKTLAEHGYIKGPRDMDGKPLAKGDWVDVDGCGKTTIESFQWDGEWFAVVATYAVYGTTGIDSFAYNRRIKACKLRRHREPDTWERIIEDACKRAADGYPEKTGHIAMADLVERCEALAGGGE